MKVKQKKQEVVTIIIPTRHEENTIGKTLERIRHEVTVPHKVIIVDNPTDPNDKTADVIKKIQKKDQTITLIRYKNPYGFASALFTGVKAVKDDRPIVFVMADMCDDPKTINLMYEKYISGFDVVAGSRYSPGGGKSGGPALQAACSTILNFTLYLLMGFPTRDITNSYKLYRGSLLKSLPYKETEGFSVSMNLVLTAYKLGATITEVPTHWQGRAVGESKFQFFRHAPGYIRLFIEGIELKVKKMIIET